MTKKGNEKLRFNLSELKKEINKSHGFYDVWKAGRLCSFVTYSKNLEKSKKYFLEKKLDFGKGNFQKESSVQTRSILESKGISVNFQRKAKWTKKC